MTDAAPETLKESISYLDRCIKQLLDDVGAGKTTPGEAMAAIDLATYELGLPKERKE